MTYVQSQVGDDTLAGRARVTISKETWEKAAESSTNARSENSDTLSKLNREMVKNLIRKRPGQSLRAGDLVRRGVFDVKSKAEFVLKTMVSRGEIREYPLSGNRVTYEVNEDWSDGQLEQLPKSGRHDLRKISEENRQKVLEYVKNRPYGKATNPNDIADGTGIPRGSIYQLVKKMVANNDIYRHEISPFTYFYTIGGEAKVTRPAATVPRPTAGHQVAAFDYLAGLPAGTVKTLREIGAATNVGYPGQIGAVIGALMKRGQIVRHVLEDGTGKCWYEVPGVHQMPEQPTKPETLYQEVLDYLTSLPPKSYQTGMSIAKALNRGDHEHAGQYINHIIKRLKKQGLIVEQGHHLKHWYQVVGVHDAAVARPQQAHIKRYYKVYDKIIAHLSTLPAGTPIGGAELAKIIGAWSGKSPHTSANHCLRSMSAQGIIVRHAVTGNTAWYEVPGVHNVATPPVPAPVLPKPANVEIAVAEPTEPAPTEPAPEPPKADKSEIIAAAMQYAWGNLDDAPALKRFIEWWKEQ